MKNKNNNRINNKYISQMTKTLKYNNVKKAVTFNQKLKSVKVYAQPPNENTLYTLRNNKVVQKKPMVKKGKSKNTQLTKLSRKYKMERIITAKENPAISKTNVNNAENSKISKEQSVDKLNFNTSSHSQNFIPNRKIVSYTQSSPTRSPRVDIKSKLKVLGIYDELKSFKDTSEITGVSSQTIRYWKTTEDSIKKKAQSQKLEKKSDFSALVSNVRINSAKKVLPNQSDQNSTTSFNSLNTKSPHTDTSAQVAETNSRSKSRAAERANRSLSSGYKTMNHDSSRKSTTKIHSLQIRSSNTNHLDPVSLIPDFNSIEDIVGEINKLSSIYESPNNLEDLKNHFTSLQSGHGSVDSYDNSWLRVKTKLQDETFKNIISDFFQGEYKLLLEIDHQYGQLIQKKSKNLKKHLDELKKYFCGSIQRLHVLKQQLG